ncbi:MAG: hypothetical protein JJ896_14605 [Rhodothermales bacterium]|nr:hypothetical protein [Rhodothermales bacterium]MBO6780882.1 hypothetical protein [Rhodothermales bacterium]
MLRSCLALLTLLLMAADQPAEAQRAAESRDGTRFFFSAGTHIRASYSDRQERQVADFHVRRARFRMRAEMDSGAGLYMQIDGARGDVGVLDFFAFYDISPQLRIRAGRMASAQPRSLIRTSMFQIDGVERAAIANHWGSLSTYSGRDEGVDLTLTKGSAEYQIFLHDGGPRLNQTTEARLAITGAASVRPTSLEGIEMGVFAGYNPHGSAGNAPSPRFVSGGAHLYYGARPGSQPIRFKLDLIAVDEANSDSGGERTSLGVSLLGAARASRGSELYARGETLGFKDMDDARYYSAGFSFSPSARRGDPYHQERITLELGRVEPANGVAYTTLILQLQLAI